ncbi:hypothetical protein K469DRAFT_703167 [Zopfia rhizophila CBS 207.26]|uniref:RanBD1 domain-containing protein n=1 Tax=Zopfia rhizophila CBS 207.26 TaxID=1314779 RepID=A0A6A6EBM4_9PEZI|nr:hypothetical protein K469DRAFT_703167 [Zopfia rhizophila CBS 207.26]
MAGSTQRHESPQPSAEATASAIEAQETCSKSNLPPSPTRSDGSSESEGRPVREKLKETRIDAQPSSDPVPSSDQAMSDAPNGVGTVATRPGYQSSSGSESGRGRIRRKRSFDDFSDEPGVQQPEKQERHARKKSRDITSPRPDDVDLLEKPAKTSVSRTDENDGDQSMPSVDEQLQSQYSTTNRHATPEASTTDKMGAAVMSPKNKRTRDAYLEGQSKGDASAGDGDGLDVTKESSKEIKASGKSEEEPQPKRHRDKSDPQPLAEEAENKTKIPPGSGFSNTSVTSPFAALSPSPQPAKPTPSSTTSKENNLPQTSAEKFKASGFGAPAGSASPLGALAGSTSPLGALGGSGSNSPFAAAAAGGKKSTMSSFASPTSTTGTSESGFGALVSNKSAFGGSSPTPTLGGKKSAFGRGFGSGFGGSSGFGSLAGVKTGLSSFATPGASGITGLSDKPPKSFGAPTEDESDDEDSDDENEPTTEDTEKDKQDKRFHEQEVETGEEGEDTIWSGRAKLYTFNGGWKERGVGPFKLNVSKEEPKKARFVSRADGTHRVLLNAAVGKTMAFGGDAKGAPPTNGQLLFGTPKADGKGLDMQLLKMKNEKAEELYHLVRKLQEEL